MKDELKTASIKTPNTQHKQIKMYRMNKELIIRSGSDAVDFALLKDGKLIELHKEEEKQSDFAVGDIFIAKIRKPVAGLNAAFVNLGSFIDEIY